MLINFTAADSQAYQKLLKHEIFTDLAFCLENRFPEIKKLAAQIGTNPILKYQKF